MTTTSTGKLTRNGVHGTDPIMVEVQNLVKHYGQLVAVDHLDLKIREGEVYGLLGPNGSGKTTTINCILSLLSYEQGEVLIKGQPMRPDSYKLKRDIGVVPQTISVFEELTVEENIDFFCGLYVSQRQERKELVEAAIDFVGLQDHRKFHPEKLSGGLRRRLNIACGMAHRPKLLFLDEPTVAVDPQSRNKILENVQQLNEEGVTIVYTTHYMEEVEAICDRIGIMDQGRMIAEGTSSEIKDMIDINEIIRLELLQPEAEVKLGALDTLPGLMAARVEGEELILELGRSSSRLPAVLEAVEAAGILYGQVYYAPPTLNTVFLEITGKALRDN